MEDRPVVAVIGTGVIGRSWAAVFARAGLRTRLWDIEPAQAARALDWARDEARIVTDIVTVASDLGEALCGAAYVQESGPEPIEAKRAMFAALDAVADADTILASSTSAHDMTHIADGLAGAHRCVVAHPVNPPHLVPAVEVVGGQRTSPVVVERTCELMVRVGQEPVRMNRWLPGFVLNRLQAALVREAIHIVASGAASVDAVDTVVRSGLGRRWALMGPFETGHTNADDGLRGYYGRYGTAYRELMDSLGPTPVFDEALIDELVSQTEAMTSNASVADLCRRRDLGLRRLTALTAALNDSAAQIPEQEAHR